MKTRILFLITLLCAAIAGVQSVHANTITVMNNNDSGAGSLRQALADASAGDTINFDSSLNGQTITLIYEGGEGLLINKNLTITGPGANLLAISGINGTRVFHVGAGKTVTIDGLTMMNGFGGYPGGGGIYNDHATLTVTNSTISGIYTGGGIYNDHGTLTVTNSTISGNSDGGIYNDGNSCGSVCSATLTVTNSTISGNSGSGIYNEGYQGSATASITNSTISGNSGNQGGGIVNSGNDSFVTTLTITNSTLSGNSAQFGGGIYNTGASDGSATASITNSTLSGNSAAQHGGGIYNTDGNFGSATLTIGDTILNAGASGENIYNDSGTVSSLGYNLSSDATGPNGSTDLHADPMLGPLQPNGGPTFTHALMTGSPAINAGDPNFTPPPNYDQRGPGYLRVVNNRIDIGAFEVQAAYAAQIQQPINADGTSVFNVRRGVVPVKFTLTLNGVATCDLPPATIAVTRTAGGTIGSVDESVYTGSADTGSNFRIDSCQYVYNLSASALGVGTYRVDIMINGQLVSSATFMLK